MKYLVVGAGLFGATIAERIANDLNEEVLVIDKRDHIGGNCYSEIDKETGIEYHKYGPHIFHTSNPIVWEYINRFTNFNNYRHKVITSYKNKKYFLPINLSTINDLFGLNLSPEEARAQIDMLKPEIYEAFIKGYTIKQWGRDPKELPPSTIARLPIRFNYNIDYFNDTWQGIPLNGYTNMFRNMLSNPKIHIQLNQDYFNLYRGDWNVVYNGPIDQFFNYKYGRLGWRTQDFKKRIINVDDYQGTAVMNYADQDIPVTRVTEFKHFYIERKQIENRTLIYEESSRDTKEGEDPYYPINTDKDKEILNKYLALTEECKNVMFGGRLGSYKYLDIDDTIQNALELYDRKLK